jgi:hypothetical protein
VLKALRARAAEAARSPSPLQEQLLQMGGLGAAAARLLPRPPATFDAAAFGPLQPIPPFSLDAAWPASGRPLPRRHEYRVGANLPLRPGVDRLVDFATLRALADRYDVLRICLRVRQQEVASQPWDIVVRESVPREQRARLADAKEEARRFFAMPDPVRQLPLSDWLRMALEETLVLDAQPVYLHPTWGEGAGPFGSDLAALEILAGDTIRPLLDVRGAPPRPPAPAYQQFLWGVPRVELQLPALDGERAARLDQEPVAQFTSDQLFYRVYSPRAWTLYGFSHVESIIVTINLALRRQQWHLGYFTDGSLPAGIIHVPETWTPAQIAAFEEGWNLLLAGDPTWKQRVKAVPGNQGFTQVKPPVHQMDFDEFLMRVTCAGMDVTPEEIGLAPRQGLGGKGWAEGAERRTERLSLRPLLLWFKEFFDHILQVVLGQQELEFRWLALDEEDRSAQVERQARQLEHGVITVNEAREELGLEAYALPAAAEPLLRTGSGWSRLADLAPLAAAADVPKAADADRPLAPGASPVERLDPRWLPADLAAAEAALAERLQRLARARRAARA